MPKLVAAALAALAAALLVGLAAESSVAAATTSCHLSAYQQRHLGTTYVLDVKVKKVGCAKAKKVVKAYHGCRHKHGAAGTCAKKVSGGWKCTDKRFNKIPIQYDAHTTCKKGTARIFSTYTQNT
jgi:hypothetical protein